MKRREMLKVLASAPAAAGFVWTEAEAEEAHRQARAARQAAKKTGAAFKPKFFTAHEYATVVILVDLIIPKDERSGSATDAGVPEFMDFIVGDQPHRQTAMRGGLAWLDRECERRFDKRFVACSDPERRDMLDDISGPQPPTTIQAPGVAFFRMFRDLTASGFWTSKMGIADLQYMGNTFIAEWKGCPDEQLKKLGIQ
jgi:gluconate 2-dehydrogenase gamma chain